MEAVVNSTYIPT